MSEQNELREILKTLGCDEIAGVGLQVDWCEKQIITLFREKARRTAHEAVPKKTVISKFGYGLEHQVRKGTNRTKEQTHKNIDAKFDAWGKT